jgi:hypothetical protein
MPIGRANSLIEVGPLDKRLRMSRRVGSASAENVRSSD